MYEKFWGLREPPFENVPDPRFLYLSAKHEEALMRLLYAVNGRKGSAILTGEIGCGKTLLSRVLLRKLMDKRFEVVLIANPSLPPISFLREILFQMGVKENFRQKVDILREINKKLLENVKKDKETILIIDEAHLIINNRQVMEEIRLLLNFQFDERFLLTLILIGQPELKYGISKMPQLEQRIAIKYHLDPLSPSETERYMHFRLKTAGLIQNIFTDKAVNEIYEYSQGIPRKINNISDLSLLIAYSKKEKVVNSNIVLESINEQT
jgi:type II secretory pathway predicted ATPase ExeA